MRQQGLALILIVILVTVVGIGGYFVYTNYSNNQITSQNTQPIQTLAPSQNPTANWKSLQFTDSKGFGYKLEVPQNWTNQPWEGGHVIPEPIELAQNFKGNNCGNEVERIAVIHFTTSSAQTDIQKTTTRLKSDGFKTSSINVGPIQAVEKLTNNPSGKMDYYVYLPTSKGYFQISARDECGNFNNTFDQILATFKTIDQF